MPAAVPGIVFLSGGQSDELATAHLNEMNRLGGGPWELSFSYGRALQAPTLKSWGGKPENAAAGQKAFLHRARCNGAARSGSYTEAMEKAGLGRGPARKSTRPRVSRPRPAFGRRRPSRPAARGPHGARSTTSPT